MSNSNKLVKKKLPRVMFAGTNSGCGKTSIVCGILWTLKCMGVSCSSVKCGPDYIDPMFHSQIFGIPSQNIDMFFCNSKQNLYLMSENAKATDITVMEGVMGYFDGFAMDSVVASSYDVAYNTNTPVVLIVNAKGMGLSVVSVIEGFLKFDTKSNCKCVKNNCIKGVILNNISSMTGNMLSKVIEERTGIKVLGCVPNISDCHFETRHLGLVTPFEQENIKKTIEKIGHIIKENVDINAIIELANSAVDVEVDMPNEWKKYIDDDILKEQSCNNSISEFDLQNSNYDVNLGRQVSGEIVNNKKEKHLLNVALAWDNAFCFYYKDNIELLKKLGCRINTFSPIKDKVLPKDTDIILLGGGYPEVYGEQLSQNKAMLNSIKNAIESGVYCLAECGGFMYLHEQLECENGKVYNMVGVIKGKSFNTKHLVRFGYISIKDINSNNTLIKGHEFHYWDSTNNGSSFVAVKPSGKRSWECIHAAKNYIVGYPHLYYYSNIEFISNFLESCRNSKLHDKFIADE